MNPNTTQALHIEERFIRLPEVMKTVGMGRTAVYDRIKKGTFPKQYKISARVSAWKLTEVKAWMDSIQQGGAA